MNKSLRTWRLTPIKDSELWTHSSHRGEIWVRAHNAIEARTLTAQRFRVCSAEGRGRMESPWYVRELTRCEVDQDCRFDAIEMPCVVYPVPLGQTVADDATSKPSTAKLNSKISARSERPSGDIVAFDVRQRIVGLLLARGIDAPGRWLDVYAAEAGDDRYTYVIIPARKLKRLIATELAALIDRALDDQETRWVLCGEDVEKLLGGRAARLHAA